MTKKTYPPLRGRPVVFGEVLFDCFPDGEGVLGGAPFNVAWHLQGFQNSPLMISSVGKDTHGDKVFEIMQAWGMDISALQISDKYPTGQVVVHLQDGQPSYDIVTDQAYDHITEQAALNVMANQQAALLYHGSLALRDKESRATLDVLLVPNNGEPVIPIFLDLNLRDPWWEMPLVEKLLQRATWVKLNDEELCEVARCRQGDAENLQAAAKELLECYDLERLIVTRGEQGAFVVSKDGIAEGRPVPVKNIMDTVGAGDAFSAVMIMGILQGWSIQHALDRALSFASTICEQRGATAQNPDLYC